MFGQNSNVNNPIKGETVLRFGIGPFDVRDASPVVAPVGQKSRHQSADKASAMSAAPRDYHQSSTSQAPASTSMYTRNITQTRSAPMIANGGRVNLGGPDMQMISAGRASVPLPYGQLSLAGLGMAQSGARKRAKFNNAQRELKQVMTIEECEKPTAVFKHLIGCADVVSELSLNFVLPCKYPSLFGLFSMPWTNTLLYGPCGSGKKTMAKCLAAERKGTFISVHAVSLLAASYDKLDVAIGALFQFASQALPIVIYIQDMDVLFTVNEEVTGFTNRILFMLASHKTRLEARTKHGDVMMIAGSSCDLNKLNPYATKVFRKTIQVALPATVDRMKLLKQFLADIKHSLNEDDFQRLGEETVGFTAGAIESVIREARLVPIQIICGARYFRRIEMIMDNGFISYWMPCEELEDRAIPMTYAEVHPKDEVFLPYVTADIVHDSIRKINLIIGSSPSKCISRLRHAYALMETLSKIMSLTETLEPEMPAPWIHSEVNEEAEAAPPEEGCRAWYEQLLCCFFI